MIPRRPRVLPPAAGESAPAACSGMLVVHEDGHRACTRQGVCRGLEAPHRVSARCGGCEACTRENAPSSPAQA